MDIHVNTVSQCTGQNHRFFDLTVAGNSYVLRVDRNDMAVEATDAGDIQRQVVDRLRSALKEAGVNLTLAAWKTALEGKDFKL